MMPFFLTRAGADYQLVGLISVCQRCIFIYIYINIAKIQQSQQTRVGSLPLPNYSV